MNRKSLIFIALFALLLLCSLELSAQCAMCKGAAEMNLKEGGGDPQGLNNGILYMLSMPYLLVGFIGYWWWRNRNKEQSQSTDFAEDDFAQYD